MLLGAFFCGLLVNNRMNDPSDPGYGVFSEGNILETLKVFIVLGPVLVIMTLFPKFFWRDDDKEDDS